MNSTFRLWRGLFEATEKQRNTMFVQEEFWESPLCEFRDAHPFDCGEASSKQLRSTETAPELLGGSREAKTRHFSRRELWEVGILEIPCWLLDWWNSFEAWCGSGNYTFRLWRGSLEATEKQRTSTLVECELGDAHPFDCGGAPSKQPISN